MCLLGPWRMDLQLLIQIGLIACHGFCACIYAENGQLRLGAMQVISYSCLLLQAMPSCRCILALLVL